MLSLLIKSIIHESICVVTDLNIRLSNRYVYIWLPGIIVYILVPNMTYLGQLMTDLYPIHMFLCHFWQKSWPETALSMREQWRHLALISDVCFWLIRQGRIGAVETSWSMFTGVGTRWFELVGATSWQNPPLLTPQIMAFHYIYAKFAYEASYSTLFVTEWRYYR